MGNILGFQENELEIKQNQDIIQSEQINLTGFENRNNICYANSVIQALYYQQEFRQKILETKNFYFNQDNPLLLLNELFKNMIKFEKKQVISTQNLMDYVKRKNELFQGDYHQDSHEFLIWILDQINETLLKEIKNKKKNTWLQNLFEGKIINKTQCQNCQNLTENLENFWNLSLDLYENTSINYCLKNFEKTETLDGNDKFYCDKCLSLQKAKLKTFINEFPYILIIHLKRFKYMEKYKRMEKLNWRIAFPFELRLHNRKQKISSLYQLCSIIVHIGAGIQYGHYISIILINDKWFVFDDETVTQTDQKGIYNIFGSQNNSGCAYILFYKKNENYLQPNYYNNINEKL